MTQGKDMSQNKDDALLEEHFDAARRRALTPDEAFIDRLVRQAEIEQSALGTPSAKVRPKHQHTVAAFARSLGGWPALASLSGATVVGLWIGIAPPDALVLAAQDLWSVQGVFEDGASSAEEFVLVEEML